MSNYKTPLRVLLTDDDEDDRLIFKEIMDEMDKEVSVNMVNDGNQLMDFLANENTPPHIIFLDLNMPNMNGIECLKEIRSHEKYSDISIAIYSTSTSEKDIDDTFRHGANIYITKPAAYHDLKEVLEKSLSAVRLNRNSDLDMANFVLKI
ncbi:response regulator [Rhodohalobacter barkolensis]|uniref:Response regulator n=1 Tax=Rhodohalobacter barkolensis TaxID=2053187 RepID=A0A2N0VEB4_9BACT|nr:response regulator [Rhodohalobacter barkolensis]PKD42500.1 response regulator [Rhodohalobacter barkolensis]